MRSNARVNSPERLRRSIEDDPNTMTLVALFLEREGFRPLTASDSRKGRENG